MTLADILQSNLVSNATAVQPLDMVLALALSFAMGVYIFYVYKKTYQGVMYSTSFGVTLIALTMVAALVILAVTSNVVLSLGMVGALSIIRFRTAIKEPLDVAFLFWALATGIVIAAGLVPLAVFGDLAIGIVLILFANHKIDVKPYIAIIACTSETAEKQAVDLLNQQTQRCVLKSKTVRQGQIELTYEVRLKDEIASVVDRLNDIGGVTSALLVSYNGDYM